MTAVESILVEKTPEARELERNVIQNNQFGLNGTDVNGVDVAYDGNGTGNCFSMAGVTSMFPADGSTFAGLRRRERLQQGRAGRDGRLDRRERAEGLEQASAPAEGRATRRWRSSGDQAVAVLAGAALVCAAPALAAPTKKTVRVGDNFFSPKTLTVDRGHDGHVALAGLRRGRRRARRQAQRRARRA